MKILHTADWHLGHQLHGHDRRFEHDAFLDWLADTIKTRDIDALLVAGDLFDTANPPASAWQQLYRFLARLRPSTRHWRWCSSAATTTLPPSWMPHELLRAFDLHLVGSISRDDEGASRPSACWCRCEARTARWPPGAPPCRFCAVAICAPTGSGGQDRLIEGYAKSMRRC